MAMSTKQNNTTAIADTESRGPIAIASTLPSKMPLTFTHIPPEIRVKIFKLCDLRFYRRYNQEYCNTPTPPIIIALRPQPICYHEALHLFYAQNSYEIGSLTNFSSKLGHYNPMSANALLTINKLKICVTENNVQKGTSGYKLRLPFQNPSPSLLTPDTIDFLFRNGNVHELHLYFRFAHRVLPLPRISYGLERAFLDSFPKWLRAFGKLEMLCIEVPMDDVIPEKILASMQEVGNKATFVRKEVVTRVTTFGVGGHENWEWTANEGELMDWSGLQTMKSETSFWRRMFGWRNSL